MSMGNGAESPRFAAPRPAAAAPRNAGAGQPPLPARPPTQPTILVVGADETFLPALRVSLASHLVYVENASVQNAVESVVVTAPDLVLLVGEAARDSGREVLTKLTASPVSSVVPVAVLGDETALDARLRAFRHGAVAVIPRSASVDAIATQVAELAREIPERGGDALGVVGEATLAEFVDTLGRELRSGILSVQPDESDSPVRLVLGGGRPLAAFIDDFVRRVRRHVVHAEPLQYEFDDRAGGTVQLLSNETRDSEPPPSSIDRLRILLADDDVARADVVAQELRARGATVVVSDFEPDASQFARLRQLDPQVLVLGESHLEDKGYALLRRMKADTRLRWTSLLVVRWREIWENPLSVPAIDRLRGALGALSESDRGLIDRTTFGDPFDFRLEVTGPSRCLRALADSGRALRVTVFNRRVTIAVDVCQGILVGAVAETTSGEQWEGAASIAALLVLSSGRVHVEPVQQPATTNLMTTVDVAFSLAEKEPLPIEPSIPAETAESIPSVQAPAAAALPSGTAPSYASDSARAALLPSSRPVSRWPRAERSLRSVGVSPPLVAVLLALAVVQGLVVAVALSLFAERGSREQTGVEGARAIPNPELGVPPRAAANAPAPALAASAPAAAEVQPKPADRAGAAAIRGGAEAGTAELADETGGRAPTCQELLGSDAAGGNDPVVAQEELKKGRQALIRGELDEAQRGFCKAMRWKEAKAGQYFELAQLLLIRRDGRAAAEYAREGLKRDPTSARGNALLGDSLARVGRTEEALQAWYASTGVAAPSPERVKQLFGRNLKEAEASLDVKDYLRAERFFRRSVAMGPDDPSPRIGLSTVLLRIGELPLAVRWAEDAVRVGPTDPVARCALADALLASGDRERAKEHYEEADKLGHPDAKRRLLRLERAP